MSESQNKVWFTGHLKNSFINCCLSSVLMAKYPTFLFPEQAALFLWSVYYGIIKVSALLSIDIQIFIKLKLWQSSELLLFYTMNYQVLKHPRSNLRKVYKFFFLIVWWLLLFFFHKKTKYQVEVRVPKDSFQEITRPPEDKHYMLSIAFMVCILHPFPFAIITKGSHLCFPYPSLLCWNYLFFFF